MILGPADRSARDALEQVRQWLTPGVLVLVIAGQTGTVPCSAPAARRTQKVHANPATHGKKPKLTASRS
jgi:hypothetical protein